MQMPLRSVGPAPEIIITTGPLKLASGKVSVPTLSPLSTATFTWLSGRSVVSDCADTKYPAMKNNKIKNALIFFIKQAICKTFIEVFNRITIDVVIYGADKNSLRGTDNCHYYKCTEY